MPTHCSLSRFARQAHVGFLAVVLWVVALPALATPPLPGADEPAFQTALSAWLDDDEETGLWGLADLALEGNTAAQVLLGLIDKTPGLQGPYLTQLDRLTRIAILRAPGGISGESWLGVVEDVPLAQAWRSLGHVSATLEVIDTFHDLGEPRAARVATITLTGRGIPQLTEIEVQDFDTELLYLLWHAADEAQRAALIDHIPAGHPQLSLIGVRIDARAVDMWLTHSPVAAPLQTLCAAVCPEAQATCRGAAYQALNSHNALLTLGTPTEALVSQEAFLASARGHASVLQRILLAWDLRNRLIMMEQMTERSACLAEALASEHRRHLRRLPVVTIDD